MRQQPRESLEAVGDRRDECLGFRAVLRDRDAAILNLEQTDLGDRGLDGQPGGRFLERTTVFENLGFSDNGTVRQCL